MAVREILTVDHPMLRRKCTKIRAVDESVRRLIDDLIDTMHDARGVGLAAPQVGVPLRVFVAQTPDDVEEPEAGKLFVMINPEIVKTSGLHYPIEGCLSMPGWEANVPRAEHVVIKGRDRNWREIRVRADGLLAQAFQHESDHLDGILFFDHLEDPGQLRRIPVAAEPAGVRE